MQILAVALALLALPWTITRIRYGILCLLCLQPFLLGTSLDISEIKIAYALVAGLLYLTWLPSLGFTVGYWWGHPVGRSVCILCLLFAFSAPIGIQHGIPLVDWFRDLTPMLSYAWILFGPAAFGMIEIRKFISVLAAISGAFSIPATIQWMYFREFIPSQPDIVAQINAAAIWLVYGFFLTLGLAVSAEGVATRRWLLAATSAFFIATILTGTRVNLIGILGGSVAGALLFRQTQVIRFSTLLRTLGVAAAGVMVFGILAVAVGLVDVERFLGRYAETASAEFIEDPTIANRLLESADAWAAFAEYPLTGQGLGYRMPTDYQVGVVTIAPEGFFVHNFYLYVLAKFGVLGAGCFIWFFLAVFRTAWRLGISLPAGFERNFAVSYFSIVVAFCIESITASQFAERTGVALFAVLTAVLVAMDFRYGRSSKMPLSLAVRGGPAS
jgi:O-antigen ligase